MGTYRIKKLIEGYKVKIEFAGKQMVAVPGQKFTNGKIYIEHKNGFMKVWKDQSLCVNTFNDRYGRGQYTLYYYIWEPTQQTTLF
jgi:hypothetical protein